MTACLRLKLTCLMLILGEQICGLTKYCLVYGKLENPLYWVYIPFVVSGILFEGILLYYLRREIYKDLHWWNKSFRSVFIFFCLRFWLLLYWQIILDTSTSMHADSGFFVVCTEHILNVGISLLVIVILFRPVIFAKCAGGSPDITQESPSGFSARDQSVGLPVNYRGPFVVDQSSESQTNTNQSRSICFLVTATVFFLLYLGEVIFLIKSPL